MEPGVGALERPDGGRVPVGRQVQGGQDRDARRRQIGGKVDAVQVHDVDRLARQHLGDGATRVGLGRALGAVVERPVTPGNCVQMPGDPRPVRRHDDRAMSGRHQGPVERRQDLLRAAGAVGRNARQGVADAEYGQGLHGGPMPRAARAARTRSVQVTQFRFQPCRS